jgi:ABC-type uncharacterized transport system involved in gliding motility auxiliary subunit
METALCFSGYLGLVLTLFGLIGAVIVGSFYEQPLIVVHLILGVLCLLAWGVTSGIKSFSKAGEVISGRTARFGYNALAYTIVALGLIVVANVFVKLSLAKARWDLTEAGVYSLSEKSQKIVEGLKQPLKLVAIDKPQVQDREKTKDLLDLFKIANDKMVSYEIVDPRANPVKMDELGMKPGNMLYLEFGEGTSKAVSRINELDEQSVTNAIIKLTRGAAKKVYYIQGHGEPSLENGGEGGMKEFADAMTDEHFTVQGLILLQSGKIPDDAAAVIVAAPKRPLTQNEHDALTAYVDNGGRLILAGDAELRNDNQARDLAKSFGIEIGNDVIIDQQLRLFAGPQMAVQFVAQQFSPHMITARLSKAEPPVFSFATSVKATAPSDAKVTYTELLKSGPNSWGEKRLDLIFDASSPSAALDPEDIKGPVPLAVAMEKKLSPADPSESEEGKFEKSGRVVVFGDTTWLENGNLVVMGNRDLALNVVNWAVGEEGGVAIGPKNMRMSVAPITQATFNIILALSFIGPEVILLFGLFVWWRRRMVLA